MAETFDLTGDGATGIVLNPHQYAAVANLPVSVCLGRRAVGPARPMALRLEQLVDNLESVPVPDKVDWYTKAAASISRVYMNNQLGCCVFSGKGHNLGVWSANDSDSANGQTILCTDQEIRDQYFAYTGGRDVGANIAEVLTYMVRTGFTASGTKYKLRGFAAFDWRSKDLTRAAIALFGALSIGFNLPGSWMNSAVWDTSNAGRAVGGHDVSPVGYGAPAAIQTTADGVVVASWGRLYLFTWAAWQSTQFIDEAYVMVPEFLWTGVDKTNPLGVNLDDLLKAMDLVKGGTVPPLPDPHPVDPTPDPPMVSGVRFVLPDGQVLAADYNTHKVTVPPGW